MSKIEVNTIDVQCGSTLTVGSSGKTVTLATGASQSGFGRTGTVDWCTTAKTGNFTAVNGKGYFVNSTSGAITVTLPSSPSAGDIVAISDYAGTAGTNKITIARNSSKFEGGCNCGALSNNREATTLVYIDGTQGWVSVNDTTQDYTDKEYITATGGTITCSGDYKIHTFTSSGCFQVTSVGNAAGSNKVSYVVVAGGGGAGGDGGGGGGAGGFREGKCTADPYTDSPLDAGAGLPVSATTYPITIGAGGSGGAQPAAGTKGSNSVFSTITSTGGGIGGGNGAAGDGGSGGGGQRGSPQAAGSGNTPPVSPAQGTNGGSGGPPNGGDGGGGGGGATVAGSANGPSNVGGAGGAGATSSITGSAVARAGGGGGGATPGPNTKGAAGTGGGGVGAGCGANAAAGTANTGGGGGGSSGSTGPQTTGGAGGSGVVVIRYKYQN
jgi:hypothetical protein